MKVQGTIESLYTDPKTESFIVQIAGKHLKGKLPTSFKNGDEVEIEYDQHATITNIKASLEQVAKIAKQITEEKLEPETPIQNYDVFLGALAYRNSLLLEQGITNEQLVAAIRIEVFKALCAIQNQPAPPAKSEFEMKIEKQKKGFF